MKTFIKKEEKYKEFGGPNKNPKNNKKNKKKLKTKFSHNELLSPNKVMKLVKEWPWLANLST